MAAHSRGRARQKKKCALEQLQFFTHLPSFFRSAMLMLVFCSASALPARSPFSRFSCFFVSPLLMPSALFFSALFFSLPPSFSLPLFLSLSLSPSPSSSLLLPLRLWARPSRCFDSVASIPCLMVQLDAPVRC
jgi:hypothetical protein